MVSNTPQDLVELQKQLGNDNANAVAKFVDGRIDTAIRGLALRVQALDAGTPGRQAASQAVRTAHEEPTDENVAAANQAVTTAEASASGGSAAPASGTATPPVAQPVVQQQPTSIQAPTPPPATPDGRTLSGAHARIDQLEAGQAETRVVVATAYASVRSGDGAMRAAARWGLGAIIVTFVLGFLFVMVSNRSLDWWNLIGFSVAVGGVAAAIAFIVNYDSVSSETTASADAIMRRWNGQGENDETPEQQEQRSSTTSRDAHARAHASAR